MMLLIAGGISAENGMRNAVDDKKWFMLMLKDIP
jgi:hypothetical protein